MKHRHSGLVRGSMLATIVALVAAWAFAGTASAAVPGLQLVKKTSALNSLDKGEFAVCPSGESALGGGGRMIFGEGQVLLDDMVPKSGIAFSAFGREDQDGFNLGWIAEASAICANPIPGLQVVSATSPSDSAAKTVTATCPPGKRVIGGGAELHGGGGQVTLDDVIPGATTVDVFAREDRDGQAGNWFESAYAVCANPCPVSRWCRRRARPTRSRPSRSPPRARAARSCSAAARRSRSAAARCSSGTSTQRQHAHEHDRVRRRGPGRHHPHLGREGVRGLRLSLSDRRRGWPAPTRSASSRGTARPGVASTATG